jgi:23S rRNA pseudouridine1911/1915/1917 synthase
MDSNPVRIQVDAEHSQERLDLYLAKRFPELSRARLQKAIADGAVLLNGMTTAKRTLVATGDAIIVDKEKLADKSPAHCVAQDIPLSILYEDDYCIAVDKPAGMVVHPGNGNREGTLVHALLFYTASLSRGSAPQRPGIVHRLDKDTSGVILVAKSDEAHRAFAAMFAQRTIRKHYVGMCCGARPAAHETIDASLGRSRRDPLRRAVREDGKQAITEYRLLGYQSGISVVRFSPRTGRTHQIRVHASVAGFPIVCDPLYGGGGDAVARLPVLERPFAYSVCKCFTRHALHAQSIEFIHPFSQEEMTIVAPLPEDFEKALALFEKKFEF